MNNSENTTAPVMTKLSLVDRALAFLKGGDDAKLARFEKKLSKYFKEQIAIRDKEIEKIQDHITDAQESFEEAVPNINPDSIAKADTLEVYVAQYVSGLDRKLQVVEELEEQISVLEAEKERLAKIQESIYG
jgi:flagellar motility protein MotE (MotC chaperone)